MQKLYLSTKTYKVHNMNVLFIIFPNYQRKVLLVVVFDVDFQKNIFLPHYLNDFYEVLMVTNYRGQQIDLSVHNYFKFKIKKKFPYSKFSFLRPLIRLPTTQL